MRKVLLIPCELARCRTEMAEGQGRRMRLFSLQPTHPPPVPLVDPGAASPGSRRSTISYVAGRLPKQLAQGQSLLRENSPIIRTKFSRRSKIDRGEAPSEGELRWQ